MSADYSEYHDCPCRDCFEIAIGCDADSDEPSLCSACEDAGCDSDGDSDCEAPHAYCAADSAYADGQDADHCAVCGLGW